MRLATVVGAVGLLGAGRLASAQNSACFGRSDRDNVPCDDNNPATHGDHCFEGFCGGWLSVPSVIWSEAEREDWIEHDGGAPCIAGETVSRCGGHGTTGGVGGTVQDHTGVCAGDDGNLPLCGGCAAGGVDNSDCEHTTQCVGAHDAASADLYPDGTKHVVFDPPERPNWIDTQHIGHFGSGFADYSGTAGGEKITWNLKNCRAGYYHLNFGYALRSGNRPMRVTVNGRILGGCDTVDLGAAADGADDTTKCEAARAFGKAHLLSFPETGGWSNWGQVGTKAYLTAGDVSVTLESAGFQGPNIDGLEVLDACSDLGDGQSSCTGGAYQGCRNCDCHECADPNSPASFPMYLAATDDHAHGQTSTDRGIESYVKWRQATGPSLYTGRINQNHRFGKYRPTPGQLGNYQNELRDTRSGGHCMNPLADGQVDGPGVVQACGWDSNPDSNPYRGRVLFKAAGDGRSFMNGIIRSENQVGNIIGHQKVDLFLEETDITLRITTCHSPVGKYRVAPMHVGQKYYIDRDFVVSGLPDFLTGVQVIQTANDDKHADASDASWLCMELSAPATVYVLYDSRATDYPDWLKNQFTNTHVAAVESTDGNMGTFNIFYKDFPNGKVCLGGNGNTGAESNYIVMAGPPVDTTCHPSHKIEISDLTTPSRDPSAPQYRVAELHPKQTYYVDRSYVLTSVPSFFVGLQSIMTANDDKHSQQAVSINAAGGFEDGFICFTVKEDARVYILYDTRATARPAWLSTYFTDKHEESGVNHTDTNMANGFEVYSGFFPLDGASEKRICLGGNDPVEGPGGAGSMYLVFVGPEEERCDGVAAVPAPTKPTKTGGGGKGVVLLLLLLALAVAAVTFGLKYKQLHAKVVSGGIYEDSAYAAYAGAQEIEMEPAPKPDGDTL